MGLNTKYQRRDLELPKYRQSIMNAIEEDLIHDENVLGVFYGGSISNQNTDLYSDIDLRIIVKDRMYEVYRLNKKQRARKWGNVLFFEDLSWATHSVAHYDKFIKVDTFYYRTEDVRPSVWLQNIKIVRDTNGIVRNVLKKSMDLSYRPSAQEFEIWRTKFFAYVHEVYRRVMRKELYYALNCLDGLRLSMVTGWYMAAGIQPNGFGDWAKLEGSRSELSNIQLGLLKQWHSSQDPIEIMIAVNKIIPEFKMVHKTLCIVLGIEEKEEWIEEILNIVL